MKMNALWHIVFVGCALLFLGLLTLFVSEKREDQMTQPKFTKADIVLFQHEASLKAELAELKETADAKRKEMSDSLGEGSHKVAGFMVEIRSQLRHSTAWKDVAFTLAPEDVVNRQKMEFTKNIEIVTVKVLK